MKPEHNSLLHMFYLQRYATRFTGINIAQINLVMLQVFDKVLHIRYCINQFHLTIVTEMLLKMTLNIHYPALKFDENGTCHVIKHLQDFFFQRSNIFIVTSVGEL